MIDGAAAKPVMASGIWAFPLLGLSLTKSSDFFDSDVPLHSSDVPIFTFTGEDEDVGTPCGSSPVI